MKRGSDKVGFLLVDGYDLLGASTELRDDVEAGTERGDGFSETYERQVYTGIKRATLEQSGFYESNAAAVHQALSGQNGVSRIVNYAMEGNVLGQRAVGWQGAMQTKYVRVASRGALTRANSSYAVHGHVDEGLVLATHALREGDGDTEATPLEGAQTTDGAAFYLQVSQLDLDGLASCVVTIRENDGGGWADLVAFIPVTATGAQRIFVDGTIEKDLAVTWAFTGLATESPSITFAVVASRR